jgi:hypothetical protein
MKKERTTMKRKMLVRMICVVALLANIVSVFAQERKAPRVETWTQPSNHVFVGEPGQVIARGGQGDNTFVFVSSEMSIDGKLVKGAPYSAQAVSESVQTLAGGNRIVRQNTSLIYRDSEGRTRREQTISVVGGYTAADGPAQTTFINDPVAGVNYILDAKNRTARKIDYGAKMAAEKKVVDAKMADAKKIEIMKMEGGKVRTSEGDPAVVEKIAAEKAAAAAGGFVYEMKVGGAMAGPRGPQGMVMKKTDPKNTRKESLGKQTVEGVEAEGTRMITTIPAGEIGNEQPIEIVSESWYSSELQAVIMSKQTDPRFGENTYRLTNINRSEPPHSLFEVPSDYTIQEAGPSPDIRYRIEQEKRRPGDNQ